MADKRVLCPDMGIAKLLGQYQDASDAVKNLNENEIVNGIFNYLVNTYDFSDDDQQQLSAQIDLIKQNIPEKKKELEKQRSDLKKIIEQSALALYDEEGALSIKDLPTLTMSYGAEIQSDEDDLDEIKDYAITHHLRDVLDLNISAYIHYQQDHPDDPQIDYVRQKLVDIRARGKKDG